MKEFQDKQKVIVFYVNDLEDEFEAYVAEGIIIGKLGRYSNNQYTVGMTKRIKYLWAGEEILGRLRSHEFVKWDRKAIPGAGYVPGIIYISPKFIYLHETLPKIISNFQKSKNRLIRAIFKRQHEASHAEL